MTTEIPESTSGLTAEYLEELAEQTRKLYLENQSPWVIGYSGGKDSTSVLQIVWYAIASLPPEQRTKPIYVLSSDTLVETPVIVDYIDQTLERINAAAKEQGMPFEAHKVVPKVEDTFWVNLIGKGYPAPYSNFRWCTDRLKIQPANRFILATVAKYGEAIVVLGVRSSESATRAQTMSLHKIKNSVLRRHSTLPNAFVYAPVEDFSTDDVWSYLLTVPSPWGNQNRDLVAMYRNAAAGECPLVIDTTTPSCGNSRFGCWVCTVVEKDKAMEAMIDNGEEWMVPLLEIRDLLSSTQDPAVKAEFREHKRRGGAVSFTPEGNIARGPYYLDFCKKLLRMILVAEKEIRQDPERSDVSLITRPELHEIRKIWRNERQDWADSVPQIFREVMEFDLDWPVDDAASFTADDRDLLDSIAEREGLSGGMVAKLLDTERRFEGMNRRAGIFKQIEKVLEEDWRTEEEIVAERQATE